MELADSKIKRIVERAIETDPILSSENIHVDVINGVVVLRGYVKTELEKSAAIEAAMSVPGANIVNAEYLRTD